MCFRRRLGGGRRGQVLPGDIRVWAMGIALCLPGCAALREVVALRQVTFRIDQVRDVRLAGIDLTAVRSVEDLSSADAARIAAAVLQKRVPLQFDLHLRAENPRDNPVSARLLGLEWALVLQDEETIHGRLERAIVLPPGEPQDLPMRMQLDLLEFFPAASRTLVNVALAAAGRSSARASLALHATPSVETPFGPMRYPEPITILRQEFGGSAGL